MAAPQEINIHRILGNMKKDAINRSLATRGESTLTKILPTGDQLTVTAINGKYTDASIIVAHALLAPQPDNNQQ